MNRTRNVLPARAGYLLEFPIMAFAAGIFAGIIGPLLPAPWNLVPWAVFGIALIAWFVYDRFFPGWRGPDRE